MIGNRQCLLQCICTCSEYRISWNSKQNIWPLYTSRCLMYCAPLLKKTRKKVSTTAVHFTRTSPCLLAYKTSHQGQPSGLISKASGSLGRGSFRFLWQVVTVAVGEKASAQCQLLSLLFFQEFQPLDGNDFCAISAGIQRKYRLMANTPDTCAAVRQHSWHINLKEKPP